MDSFGISAKIIGPMQSLKHAQAERGFAFVSEKTCEDLLLHEGKEVPEGDDKDENHRKTELAMACIAAIKPAWTSEEASAALAKAFLAEHPDIYEHIHVPADCLTDVVDEGEVQKVMEWEQEKQKEQKKKQFVLQTRDRKMHKYFKIAKSWKCGGKPVPKQPHWLPV